MDEKQLSEIYFFSLFPSKRAQEKAHHKAGEKQRNPAIDVSIKSLEGDDNNDLDDYGGEAHNSQREEGKR